MPVRRTITIAPDGYLDVAPEQEQMPDRDYSLATVIDDQPITLENVIEYLTELAPVLKFALRVVLVYVWLYLLVSLYLRYIN